MLIFLMKGPLSRTRSPDGRATSLPGARSGTNCRPCLPLVPEEWEGVATAMAGTILPAHLAALLQRCELPAVGMLLRPQAPAGFWCPAHLQLTHQRGQPTGGTVGTLTQGCSQGRDT